MPQSSDQTNLRRTSPVVDAAEALRRLGLRNDTVVSDLISASFRLSVAHFAVFISVCNGCSTIVKIKWCTGDKCFYDVCNFIRAKKSACFLIVCLSDEYLSSITFSQSHWSCLADQLPGHCQHVCFNSCTALHVTCRIYAHRPFHLHLHTKNTGRKQIQLSVVLCQADCRANAQGCVGAIIRKTLQSQCSRSPRFAPWQVAIYARLRSDKQGVCRPAVVHFYKRGPRRHVHKRGTLPF